jgi:transcriptional regulator with XRE-family HTH domain
MPPKKVRVEQPAVVGAFAARLRERRLALGLTQAQLAERAMLSANHVNSLEAGRAAPGLDVMDRLASALGTTLAGMLPDGDAPAETDTLRAEAERLFRGIVGSADRETLRALVPLLARFADEPVGRG